MSPKRVRIKSCYAISRLPSDTVYVGRGPGGKPTQWGNPFVVGRHGTREECVRTQEAYITDSLTKWPKPNVNCAETTWLASVSLVTLSR
jgi:hypothetical protein